MSEAVLLEVQKTFDFFKATTDAGRIDRVLVCGGASQVEGFTELIAERFDTPVERLNPFKTIGFDAASSKVAASADAVSTASVAVGLALRRMGDR
jgi:type IV pilus assembly protein PilM